MTSPADLFGDPPAGPGFVERWAEGRNLLPLLGVDEAGRGCLAGPVVAAAVILPKDVPVPGIDDSKRLTARTRERLAREIVGRAATGIARVEAAAIDRTNILAASLEAMRQAIARLRAAHPGPVGIVIVDGNQPIPGLDLPQRPWPHGDALSLACGAASIVAKVARDAILDDLDRTHPGYGFARHKGYGTAEHLAALERLGPCPEHRRTFAPVARLLARGDAAPAGPGPGQNASS